MIPQRAVVVWTRRKANKAGRWHRVATINADAVVSACLRVIAAPVDFRPVLVRGAIACVTCVRNKAAPLPD